ncbi:MAG: MDR family MFS transporter [Gammaproteobacteria bacterium]|jgi:EmrB/QacA subfamily drug resistance transporter|nr:MDR family MFS transporter [Gammaproteobacteria bacterium]
MNHAAAPAGTPAGFRDKLLAMLGLCFVLIMVALDQTVIGTALPTIVAELEGFHWYAWVGTAYLLASIVTVPVFGKLGDEHGRRHFILVAIALFAASSLLCGLAQDMAQLVWARVLQGIAGGMLIATTFASVPDMFPEPRERLRWQVLFSSAFGLANALGPTLGGAITEYLGWRWVFYINPPVAMLALWFVWRHLPLIRHREGPASRLDWPGAVLLGLTLTGALLLFAWLGQGKSLLTLLALGAGTVLAGVALVLRERRCPDPLLPVEMFADRTLRSLFLLSALVGFCLFGIVYYAPLLFQGGFGLTPKEAGLLVTPLAVFITVGSIVNGRIVSRLRTQNVMLYTGLLVFGGAAIALAQIGAATPHALIYGVMVVAGLGMGLLMPNLTLLAQSAVPRARLGVTTATLQSTRMIGGMTGMALIGVLVTQAYQRTVGGALRAADAGRWTGWLDDPNVLIDREQAAEFAVTAAGAGENVLAILGEAREALVTAIHGGHWLVALAALAGLLMVHRLPALSIHGGAARRIGEVGENT